MINYKEIVYGFEYGSAKLTRLHSDEKTGSVVIMLETPKHHSKGNQSAIQIYVTKTGKVRIFSNGEWSNPNGKQKKNR